MEEKYWELREAVERAYDRCYAHNTAENHIAIRGFYRRRSS